MLEGQQQAKIGYRHLPLASGFTLIEMAVVLLILGTLLGGLLQAVAQVSNNARFTNAQTQIEHIEQALYGYAQAYGRLPCPATSVSRGFESRTGGVDSSCSAQHGFVPAATLSLSGSINGDALLLDPWANPYRYSVSPNGTRSFTSATELSTVFNDPAGPSSADMLRVCEDADNCGTTLLTDLVPAIVLSMGPDWATFTSNNEILNGGGDTDGSYTIKATDADTNDFVDAEYSEDLYDDILVWLSPYILYNKLIEAGRLP